jgi:hypothetical protein
MVDKIKVDPLSWIHDKKNILQRDKERWLEIIEMFYTQFKESTDPVTREFCRTQMKFCGEQSQEIKKLIQQIK